jgi:Ca-activated chloride channel family protein
MLIRDITYDFPQAAYLLLFIFPAWILYYSLFRYRQRSIQQYANVSTLPHLLRPRSPFLTMIKILALNLAWIFACLAFMNPKGNLQYQSSSTIKASRQVQGSGTPRHRTHDVIFLIDASASMSVSDMQGNQTRLEAAKEIVGEVISQLRGENVAMYAMTSELIPLVPSTLDYLFARLALRQLKINEGDVEGTNFEKVLTSLKIKVLTAPDSRLYTVILLSDGGDNQIETLQGQTREQAILNIVQIISNLQGLNLRLFTIGVGSKEGGIIPHVTFKGGPVTSKLEDDLLKALANQGRGAYYEARSLPVWNLTQGILNKMGQDPIYEEEAGQGLASTSLARKVIPAKKEEMVYDLYYQIPLGLAILCLLIYFALPDIRL